VTDTPKISVLIPCYNLGAFLDEAVDSVLRQTYQNFEIVFGVRHLHDPAVAVVERLKREFPALELKLAADSRTIGTNV